MKTTKTINPTRRSLRSAISRAVSLNNLEATQQLIGQGAPVDRSDWAYVTINKILMYYPSLLAMAIEHNNNEMVALLIAAGANPNSGYRTQLKNGMLIADIKLLSRKKMGKLVNPADWHTVLSQDSYSQLQLRTVKQHINTLAKLIQTIPIKNDFKVRLQQNITNRNIDSLIRNMNTLITEANNTANHYNDRICESILISFFYGLLVACLVGTSAPLVWALLPAITAAIIGGGIALYCSAQVKEQLSAADSAREIRVFLTERSSAASPSGGHTPQATEEEFTSHPGYC